MDTAALESGGGLADGPSQTRLRWFVPPLAVLLSIAQSILLAWASNAHRATLAGTLVPVLGFVLLVLTVLLFNPALRLLMRAVPWSLPPLGRVELMTLFAAMLVTAGISTFGLVDQLVPMVAAPFDPNWNTPQRGWDHLFLSINKSLYITDTKVIAQFREGLGPGPPPTAGWKDHLRFYEHVIRGIPWLTWLQPLGFWLILIAATYGLFYSLTYVTLPFWSRREKLIFPLAKLPESVLPDSDRLLGAVPQIFGRPGFWFGFITVFLVLGWNATVELKWGASGLMPITRGMGGGDVERLLQGTPLVGLATSLLILFTATSLAFLIPMEMSFSVWFYHLYGRGVLMVAVWLGYGISGSDFPTDFYWNSNPSSAQGGGAMFMFSAISLARCLHDFKRLAHGHSLVRKVIIALPIVGMVVSMAVLTAWLSWNNLGWGWSLLFVLVMTLLTVGLMRIVAESGIYWIQTHAGFFHIYKMLGMSRFLAPAIIGPIFPIYTVLFLDVKCLLALSLINAAQLRQEVGGSRVKFHFTIIASILASVVVSIFFAIFLAYVRGADRMHMWFYSSRPQRILDSARDVMNQSPSSVNPVTVGWFGIGAIWVVVSMMLRQRFFWFPHPLGFIMLINPLMDHLWLSFFIAWLIKKCVVKYGGKATFEKTRGVAIGVITGELTAIVVWIFIALLAGIHMPSINLDRYGP